MVKEENSSAAVEVKVENSTLDTVRDDNILKTNVNAFGNEYTIYKNGGFSYKNFDINGQYRSFYLNNGAGVKFFQDFVTGSSWYEDDNTGETTRTSSRF